jgi:hypothetical protein
MRTFSLVGALAAGTVSLLLGSVGQSPAAAAAGRLVQPSGATFAVAFPNPTYRIDHDGAHVRDQFPGSVSASAYYETPATYDILDPASPVPHAPTYLVSTAVFRSSEAAEHYVNLMGNEPGMKPVLVGSVAGYHALAREGSAINNHNVVTQPHAFEALLSVSQGSTVYVALAITSKASDARAFTRSLQLGSSSTGGSPAGLGPQPVLLGGATSHSSAYTDGKYAGYGVLALLVIAIAFKSAKRPRRTSSSHSASARHAPTGAADPNSQFGWMYQGAPAPIETTAAPPSGPIQWDPPTA